MIDVHCHILPGIDDGSRNTEESKALISEEMNQGINTIIFTPHFYAQRDSVGHFLEKRANSFSRLQSAVQFDKIGLKPHLGAEVYYFGGIGKAEMVPELCVTGTDILLLEMPFGQWTKAVYEDVEQLVKKPSRRRKAYRFCRQKEKEAMPVPSFRRQRYPAWYGCP